MAPKNHPNRISPRHSVLSQGYTLEDRRQDAVFHECISCGYLQDILPKNLRRGRGVDRDRLGRLRCGRCQNLIDSLEC